MLKKVLLGSALVLATSVAPLSMAAADPTLHEVYQAAEAGRLDDAQSMMKTVLQDHPNSAKAHFVEAELLAKQGRFAQASAELKTAEHLAPGLPFAQPQAVANLRALVSGAPASRAGATYTPAPVSVTPHVPWGMILLVLLAIGFVAYILRSRNAAQPASGYGGPSPNGGYPSYPGGTPGTYGTPYPGQASGGIGSGILGGLATGAAMGAGVVAGEALVHRLIDGDRPHAEPGYMPPAYPGSDYRDTSNDDMGGTDFGISDNSSWDDGGSSGGGGDWDS